jgi:diguanylate cyclase (GGDEF)-like protein
VANSHIEAVRDAGGRLLHYVCGQTDTTRLKRAENHMEYLVTHDSLTSLANRPALEQIAELCLAHHEDPLDESTVMIVDLDRFKDVNDSLGHGIGDLLLSQVGKRLAALSRRSDIVARMGGDEFGLVFPGLTRASALPMAEKILATLHDPIILQEHTFGLSASIGIAVHPHDGRTIGELLKNADTALHQAKSEGRNAAVFYSREMNQATYEILRLEAELRSAIDEGQLVTFYQPKIRLDDGAPIGAEALVRWQHPSRGLIAPAEFIPIAERSGLINDIGKWVLGDVCRQLARWRDRGLSPLPVAVNLAARHFRSPELPALVSTLLDTHQLPTEMLELELTETTLLVAGLQVQANLAELRRLGVSLAIDDFGTGYSSLSYLKRMPINVLKIDQSFVRDLESGTDDQALVTSIIALGHSLGLKLVAEGVETDRQAEILRRQGCDFGQGYLFGRPVPADEYVAWHSARVAENP